MEKYKYNTDLMINSIALLSGLCDIGMILVNLS